MPFDRDCFQEADQSKCLSQYLLLAISPKRGSEAHVEMEVNPSFDE